MTGTPSTVSGLYEDLFNALIASLHNLELLLLRDGLFEVKFTEIALPVGLICIANSNVISLFLNLFEALHSFSASVWKERISKSDLTIVALNTLSLIAVMLLDETPTIF